MLSTACVWRKKRMRDTIASARTAGRDSRVELLRLLACFSVLVLHFKPSTYVEGQWILSRIFVTCLCTDAVGIFLLITGFFFFGRQHLFSLHYFLLPIIYFLNPVFSNSRVSLQKRSQFPFYMFLLYMTACKITRTELYLLSPQNKKGINTKQTKSVGYSNPTLLNRFM